MPHVIQGDIIANLTNTLNFAQGESKAYTINLYRNTIGNYLRANTASSISISILDSAGTTLSIFSTATGGTNLPLTIGNAATNSGDLMFTVPTTASAYYPAGKIFLGDAGAYTFGFLLGVILITLKYKHPEISGWSFVLILFWPVTETSHSIFRRILKRRSSDKPDMMHMHHLIMRTIENMANKKVNRKISNPLSTAVILPLASVPVLVAITFPEADLILALMTIGFLFLFALTYLILYRLNILRVSKYNISVSKILGI